MKNKNVTIEPKLHAFLKKEKLLTKFIYEVEHGNHLMPYHASFIEASFCWRDSKYGEDLWNTACNKYHNEN